ncbi:MAG: ATP-dependent DNA helicase [Gammaproteobacteria bacterium]|nr:ATP-dependent DNA helicase [Gammaproteobacteria bacterium]
MAKTAKELTIQQVLGAEGIIAEFIPGFQPRDSQLSMAELVEQAIQQHQNYAVEASTGIGKSFAYLVPAFLSDSKIAVSTGTKNLQDQLFVKDIPLISKTILSGKKVALLKGRSNYACPHRINKYRLQKRFQTRNMAVLFDALSQWCQSSRTGDIVEFADIPENDSLWFYATSTADNCLGGDCPEFNECFVLKARRRAQEADILVINHHLFFSDQSLRQEGFGELLPDIDVLIFDEAHQLPDIAAHFFSLSLSKRQIDLLLRDIIEAQVTEARENKEIQECCQQLQKAVDDFRLLIGDFSSRGEWKHIQHAPRIKEGLQQFEAAYWQLHDQLEVIKARGKDLSSCFNRLQSMHQTMKEFLHPEDGLVSWYEWNERSFRLMLSPIDISQQFSSQLQQNDYQAVLFTSATLSADGSFDYFTHRLGLDSIECVSYASPFDYQSQALLFLPENLPDPSDDQFAADFIEICAALIRATQGNCFILFTSYRMLSLGARLLERKISNPLFVQGEKQRSELIQAYMETPDAVLLGTSSFWEGVDVKGDKLKLVIIDKLPFKSPGDPVYKQRLNYINKQGGNAFMDVQVPEATIALRQGVGRLIRDVADHGIVMIADNRLYTKSYGPKMLSSLPPMKRTSNLSEVIEFAREI